VTVAAPHVDLLDSKTVYCAAHGVASLAKSTG
jgi:hypothetical protein